MSSERIASVCIEELQYKLRDILRERDGKHQKGSMESNFGDIISHFE